MNNIRQKALFIIDNVYNKGAFFRRTTEYNKTI